MFLAFASDDIPSPVALLLSTLHRNRKGMNFLKGKLWTISETIKWSDYTLIQTSVQHSLWCQGDLTKSLMQAKFISVTVPRFLCLCIVFQATVSTYFPFSGLFPLYQIGIEQHEQGLHTHSISLFAYRLLSS